MYIRVLSGNALDTPFPLQNREKLKLMIILGITPSCQTQKHVMFQGKKIHQTQK